MQYKPKLPVVKKNLPTFMGMPPAVASNIHSPKVKLLPLMIDRTAQVSPIQEGYVMPPLLIDSGLR
jgi:hypothetical protein